MRKIYIFLLLAIFLVSSVFVCKNAIFAEQNMSGGYAVVNNSGAYLYRTPTLSENYINKFFLLEESYFVKVLSRPNDEFYYVEYMDIFGYVKVDDVVFVVEQPENPYLDFITFDIKSNKDVCLLKSPNGNFEDINVLYNIPFNAKNLCYLGKISAVENQNYMGNIWYYCCYKIDENSLIYGYLYAPLCCNLSPITKNSEVLTATSISSIEKILFAPRL